MGLGSKSQVRVGFEYYFSGSGHVRVPITREKTRDLDQVFLHAEEKDFIFAIIFLAKME